MTRILVTGAGGKLGGKTVDALLRLVQASEVAVSVRDPARAERLRALGVEVRRADYDDPASLDEAFAGVERLLFVSSGGASADGTAYVEDDVRLRQHRAVVDAAARAGVGFLAYTSSPRADSSDMAVAAVHGPTERLIRDTGVPFAFLRNNWYLENAFDEIEIVPRAIAGEPIITAMGSGRIGWVLRDDFAEAAARVIAGVGDHDGAVYELSGEPVDWDAFARVLGGVVGREIEVRHVDDETYGRLIDPLVKPPATSTEAEVEFQDEIRRGLLDIPGDDLERVLGRRPTPLAEALRITIERRGLTV